MGLFSRKHALKKEKDAEFLGLLTFDNVNDALAAERALKAGGYDPDLVAPPHHLRFGCDLALALPSIEHIGAVRLLEEKGIRMRGWHDDSQGVLKPVSLVTTQDFGQWTMVRAGNMKLTFDKESGVIVNTSGGGCPDIPYLSLNVVGKKLTDVKRPKELGYTLCSLMLDRAYLEALTLMSERSDS